MSWFLRVSVEWAVIIICLVGASYLSSWPAWIIAGLIVGSRQFSLLVLGHDAAHRHAGRLGEILSRPLCFWPMLIGFKAFKSYHWKHHAGVGSSSDPEMYHRVRAWRIYDRFGLGGAAVYYLLGFGAWDVITLYAKLRPAALEDYIGLACFIMLAFFLPAPVIMTLVLSTFTSFMCVFQVRGYTEHRGTLTFYKTKPALWKRLVFLPHGTWLHWEHHRWPGTDLNELYQRHLENLDLQWSRDVIK